GVVVVDHRVLHRVAEDDHQDEVVEAELAKLAFAEQAEADDQEGVDHCGLAGDDGRAVEARMVEDACQHVHGRSPQGPGRGRYLGLCQWSRVLAPRRSPSWWSSRAARPASTCF